MGYAVRHPDNVKRLVVLNTGAFRIPEKMQDNLPWELMLVRKPVIGPLLVRGFNAFSRFAIPKAITNKTRRTPEARAGYLAPYNSWKNRVAVLKAVRDIPLTEDAPAHKELAFIEENLPQFNNVPKIFFWGLKDFVFNDIVLEKWLEIFPGSETRTYEDAGHYVLDDAYDRIIPDMEQFLISNPLA
jgi:haloalkane dehalogenase